MRIVRIDERAFVPASHEDPQRPGVMKRVIATRDELLDGRPQMINWARLPSGHSFRAHYHEDMEEAFVVIRGTATMDVDGQAFDLNPGDAVFVAPREVHSMTNHSTEEVEYLVIGISRGENGRTIVTANDR